MSEYKVGTKIQWLASGDPVQGEIIDCEDDGRYVVHTNGWGVFKYTPSELANATRILSQPDEPVPMFKASVLESVKGQPLTEEVILKAVSNTRFQSPKSTDAPLELAQLQQYRDYLKRQMDAITGQHVEGLAGRLVATSAVGQLSAVQAMAREAAEIAKLNAKAGDPVWCLPSKRQPVTCIQEIKEPDLRCPNVHERTGFRCRFDKNQRHSCETPAGFPIGRTMPGDAKPGEKRHCFGPVILDLPARGPQPKPPKVEPVPTMGDSHGMRVRGWDGSWGPAPQRPSPPLAALNLDTLHDRLPRRWTKDAWRTR